MLRYGATGAGALLARNAIAQACFQGAPIDIERVHFTGCGYDGEHMPTSPFILQPFTEEFVIPQAMKPGWRAPDGTLLPADHPEAWKVRKAFGADFATPQQVLPGPELGHQDAFGDQPATANPYQSIVPRAGTHQLWPGNGTTRFGSGVSYGGLSALEKDGIDRLADPILYHIRLQVSRKLFTKSPVAQLVRDPVTGAVTGFAASLPPGANGGTPTSFDLGSLGDPFLRGTIPAWRTPESTIYGFNGTFPGPMINSEYGKPVLIRFENDLDYNPDCLSRGDFGAPDWAFLTHLHNGHTAPESDGQPHHCTYNGGGYQPKEWVDNLYLQYAAGNDDREKQSFLWFHDHRMHHTGPNVYKGMVGLMPHYDPKPEPGFPDGRDPGDETKGLRLPGVRQQHADGTFDVLYDIPMAFYDCALDDGQVQHQDNHTPKLDQRTPVDFFPELDPSIVCGNTHPEWWGKLFLNHYVNHGFVGDIFTVNGVAYPTLVVKRRKYRFRFLDASLARQYRLSLRQGTPMAFPGQQGQWNFGQLTKGGAKKTTSRGTLCMKMTQIASEGGLLPAPIDRQEVEIWPAKRREVIVDFTTYIDGRPTRSGDVLYLCDTLQMLNGRKETGNQEPGFDAQYCVPLVKIVIDGPAPEGDQSLIPAAKTELRPMQPVNFNAVKVRDFNLQRTGLAGEDEWVINGLGFVPFEPLAAPIRAQPEAWGINNGGGGWTHPMHIHMEEHHVIFRDTANLEKHRDDTGKEDVVALEPSENTTIWRNFRTFCGNYVAHCHNLAHEDHNMMFGWTIVPF